MTVDRFPDNKIIVEGKEYLYFGGTSYLGMATNSTFQDVLIKNIKKWGTFYGSSRNANVKLSVYNEFEQLFAKQVGAEASLSVSSGTLAGKLTTDYLSKNNTAFFHYPKTHPAILVSHSLPLFVNGKLHPRLTDAIVEEIVITADAILSLETTPTSFNFLDEISPEKKITLVVDESHSLGIVGKHGEGIFNTIPNTILHRKIFISSLGKALGLSGGSIASDKEFINALKEEVIFVSSSGANPAYLQTYLETQELYNKQRKKLRINLDLLNSKLRLREGFVFNADYPVIYSNDSAIFKKLLQHQIIITNFNYPTYKNAMNRIVITANHTEKQLKKLIHALNY